MCIYWFARKKPVRILGLALLLIAGSGEALGRLAQNRSDRGDVVVDPAPYVAVPTSRSEDIGLGETSRPYAKYFEPEALARQAEQLDPDIDVDQLHPATIRTPEGPLGTLFLDNSGEIVLAVKYPLVRPFSEGLAAVGTAVTNGRSGHIIDFGYIDRTGRLAIDPVYENAGGFHDGLAAVRKGGRWGYIDRNGRVVIPFQYRIAEEFRDGLARVWPGINTVQFLDKSGKVLFKGNEADVGQFSEGLLFARLPSRPGVGPIVGPIISGYMDRNFEFVVRLDSDRFLRCEEFHDGRAAVELSRSGPPRWGFLSRKGEVVIKGPFLQVKHFSEGLAAVMNISRERVPQWGYIDTAGGMVVEPRFLASMPFSEGLAAVLVPLEDADEEEAGDARPRPDTGPTPHPPRGRWGFIDRQGHMVIEPRFSQVLPFENGLAYVRENALLDGYIDKAGSYVWKLTDPGRKKGTKTEKARPPG